MTSCTQIYKLTNKQKLPAYEALAKDIFMKKNIEGIENMADHLLNKEGNDQYGRTYITPKVMQDLIGYLRGDDVEEDDQMALEDLMPLMKKLVPLARNKGEDFPDVLMEAIYLQYQLFMAEDEFQSAASTLTGFKFNTYRAKRATPQRQVSWHVETTEAWLEIDEVGKASQAIKKAQQHLKQIKDRELIVQFRTCFARVLDADRKFLEAARAYQTLTQDAQGIMNPEDILLTLGKAVICAILATAGSARSRVLTMLFSDGRTKDLRTRGLLEKMFKGQIIRNDEVKKFEEVLAPHQNATTASGRTVLQNSIVSHNLFAASHIYNNIKFDELGSLLGLTAQQSESLAQTMIEQGRLKAVMDQIKGVVEFQIDGVSAGTLSVWDNQIQNLCLGVNAVLETIDGKHPGKYIF